jgi:hypothetical protein
VNKFVIFLVSVVALVVPVAIFGEFVAMRSPSSVTYSMWVFFAVVCFVWGVYILRQSRLAGWLCVAVAVSQFALQLLPLFVRGK